MLAYVPASIFRDTWIDVYINDVANQSLVKFNPNIREEQEGEGKFYKECRVDRIPCLLEALFEHYNSQLWNLFQSYRELKYKDGAAKYVFSLLMLSCFETFHVQYANSNNCVIVKQI